LEHDIAEWHADQGLANAEWQRAEHHLGCDRNDRLGQQRRADDTPAAAPAPQQRAAADAGTYAKRQHSQRRKRQEHMSLQDINTILIRPHSIEI
jgi:hypothetical protein